MGRRTGTPATDVLEGLVTRNHIKNILIFLGAVGAAFGVTTLIG
jgi:hypothetical protein